MNGKKVQVTVPRDEWIAVSVPSIVDTDVWQQAQRCLDQNKQRASRNNTKHDYLLRGMIVCECKCHWTATPRPTAPATTDVRAVPMSPGMTAVPSISPIGRIGSRQRSGALFWDGRSIRP